jgi:glycosyltransferase involved in cell wall biosynthesis
MTLRLISHVNADSDIIEAWLKYYLRLGVDRFHLVLHGPAEENDRLLAIKDSYPVTIEDTYEGPFHSDEKKRRLDIVLARYTGQWIVLADSDEFVEFPYRDIRETISQLESAGANVLFAPMLQRLKSEGSLDSPPVVDDPFQIFQSCSIELYRKMGVKADTFKFPLFYCANGTQVAEEGNHHPPLGLDPKATGMRGVTHHFKFRQTVSVRLEKRINSTYQWRHESVGFQKYLERHGNRLPLEDAFLYSRDELFRRRLLRELSPPKSDRPANQTQCVEKLQNGEATAEATKNGAAAAIPSSESDPKVKKILFVLPKTADFGGLERHLLDLLARLPETVRPSILCFGQDIISPRIEQDQRSGAVVKCVPEPRSLWDWIRTIREAQADIIVFCYSWIEAFPWQAPAAALLAGVPRRFAIQHLIPPQLPPLAQGNSLRGLLRRLIGKRARRLFKLRVPGYTSRKTICVSDAVRDALVDSYSFPARKTITVRNGVSTSKFSPCKADGAAVRARLDVEPDEFLLVCAARLVEAKGVDILIYAISRVVRQGIRCKCVIVGDGPLKEQLMKLANSEGLTVFVSFEGFQKDVRPYLHAGSAFILTSHLEGLPISALEAMACGLPCIVTNVGGSAEAVKDQVVGLVVPPGSTEAVADAILSLATNPGKRAQLAGKTRETVQQSFDIEQRMSELIKVITA